MEQRTSASAPAFPILGWFSRGAAALALTLLGACTGAGTPKEVLTPAAPGFLTQPTAQTVTVGQAATFSATGSGFTPLSYQWSRNGVAIPSATNATYITPSATKADQGAIYTVVVSNRLGSNTSNPSLLNVQWAPTLTTQPSDLTIMEGLSATFLVAADASPAATYQWQKNLTDIPGATTASHTLNPVALSDNGASFRCQVTNTVGSITSTAAHLTVTPAPIPPVITSFTASPATIIAGQSTTLTWIVSGATSLSIDNGVGSVTGLFNKVVAPGIPGTYTYTLTATNAVGPTLATAQVIVNPVPTYALTINLGTGVTGAPAATTSYTQGTAVNYSYAVQTGYQNLQVTLDGNPVATSGTLTMNGAHTLDVTAQVQTFTITAGAGANGTISPAGLIPVNYGSSQAFTITPNAGYQVASVTVDGVAVGALASYTFTNVTANHTLSAAFAPLPTYALTINLGTGTTGTPAATASYPQGTVVTYTFALLTGYQNLVVTLDGAPVAASGTVTMNGLHTLTVSAQLQSFTITASPGANGTISPAGATVVSYGGNLTYTITPNVGYQVLSVLVDGVSVGTPLNYAFTNVTSDHTISATFQILTYPINAVAGANGTISPAGVTSVNYGSSQLYTMTPNAGYQIATVTVDGSAVGPAATYTFSNVTASHTITVTFSPLPIYTLTVTMGGGVTGVPGSTATYTQGAVVNYNYALAAGYKNLLVTLDGTPVAATGSVTMNASHTLVISSVIQTFTVTATAGLNGAISPPGVTLLNWSTSITYTITADPGFQVANVLVDGVSVGAVTTYTFTNLTADHTIFATFAPPPGFTLTVIKDAGSTGAPAATASYSTGTSVHYSYTLMTGYLNLQVFLDGAPVGVFGDIVMNGPHTLTVTTQIQTFTITASVGPNGTITPAGVTTVNFNGSQAYTITADPGYHVGNVLVDGGSVGAVTSFTITNVTSNMTISATFLVGPVSPLAAERISHSATLLADGKTLVTGGSLEKTPLASALLYDPVTHTWSQIGSLGTARSRHSATRLLDGRVLVVGGTDGAIAVSSVEIYDPASGSWSPTGALGTARAAHAATLLPSGKVLVSGGQDAAGALLSSEIYDPMQGAWTPTADLTLARSAHSATLLPSGKVLVAGGQGASGRLSSSELFDSSSRTWAPSTESLAVARSTHSATLLANGTVLVVGGDGESGTLSNAEIFDPSRETWAPIGSLSTARTGHTATALPNGLVLVAGGGNASNLALPSSETYDSATGTWTSSNDLAAARKSHTATLLPDGSVVLAFGTKAALTDEIVKP